MMNVVATKLADLKVALQDLESAVQLPRDEDHSINNVLHQFPKVLLGFRDVVKSVLASHGFTAESTEEIFAEAHRRGWLKGQLPLWLRLLSDYQILAEGKTGQDPGHRAVAQDVRAGCYMFWETFELLTARFRYETQSQPISKTGLPGRVVSRLVLQVS